MWQTKHWLLSAATATGGDFAGSDVTLAGEAVPFSVAASCAATVATMAMASANPKQFLMLLFILNRIYFPLVILSCRNFVSKEFFPSPHEMKPEAGVSRNLHTRISSRTGWPMSMARYAAGSSGVSTRHGLPCPRSPPRFPGSGLLARQGMDRRRCSFTVLASPTGVLLGLFLAWDMLYE